MTESAARAPARPTPPRPPIAFRVGVVGHRPDRLPTDEAELNALRARLGQVLAAVAEAVAGFAREPFAALYDSRAAPILRAVSPLAEGADRLFAEEALRLGYQLTCVTPFAQAEFERDFDGGASFETGSLARFRNILDRADAVGGLIRFELDGTRERDREAYEAAGRVVLNQSDLLIVVWDGGAAAGAGGTVDTLRDAISFSVPALWIDSRAPNGWRLLRNKAELDCLALAEPCAGEQPGDDKAVDAARLAEAMASVVRAELGLPLTGYPPAPDSDTLSHLQDFLAEPKPRLNLAFAWKMFRDLMDRGRLASPRIRVPQFVDQIRADWPIATDEGAPPGAAVSWINDALRAHYAWSDKLADHYADAHRSGFIWSSLLAAGAVFTALLPMAGHFTPRGALATALAETVILVFMVGLPTLARRRRWHQRWLEYRVQAELIRELRILVPLGGGRPLPRTSTHLASYGDPARSWMYWRVRALARATGLPDVRATPDYIASQRAELLAFVGDDGRCGGGSRGQMGFHHLNCERMERIHHRLHRLALILFGITVAAVGVNWAARVALPQQSDRLTDWLILVSACFPALGAALATINNQGEFARLQRRSHAMAQGFAVMRARILGLGQPTLAGLTELAAQIAAMMVDENTEWRIVVLDLPHAAG